MILAKLRSVTWRHKFRKHLNVFHQTTKWENFIKVKTARLQLVT